MIIAEEDSSGDALRMTSEAKALRMTEGLKPSK